MTAKQCRSLPRHTTKTAATFVTTVDDQVQTVRSYVCEVHSDQLGSRRQMFGLKHNSTTAMADLDLPRGTLLPVNIPKPANDLTSLRNSILTALLAFFAVDGDEKNRAQCRNATEGVSN